MPNATPLRPADPGRIGQYRLAGRLVLGAHDTGDAGAGGPAAGTAYLARTARFEPVTITLLDPLPPADSATRDRFIAEARAARRVAPFCAARILDSGFHEDLPYLVCEYVAGPTLREAVESDGPAAGKALYAIATGAATGLAAIHQAGLVHGDFGPDRVILSRDGPRILHAGISPPYGPFTPTRDVLAWARTVLFAASGERRAGPSQSRAVAGIPESLHEVIADCLDPDPASRPTAKIVVTRLLGHASPPAGVLAEGSRMAAGLAPRAAIAATSRGMPRENAATPAAAGVTGGPAEDGHIRKAGPAPAAGPAAPAARPAGPARVVPPPPRKRGRPGRGWAAVAAGAGAIAAIGAFLYIQHDDSSHSPAASPAQVRSAVPQPSAPTTSAPAPSGSATPAIPSAFSGTWAGTVHQHNALGLSFAVQINLTGGGQAGTVSYPSLGCSGPLTPLSASNHTLVLQQGVVSGQQTCGQGTVTLTRRSGSTLSYSFAQQAAGGPSTTGTLSRP